jgi:hypothetical protein
LHGSIGHFRIPKVLFYKYVNEEWKIFSECQIVMTLDLISVAAHSDPFVKSIIMAKVCSDVPVMV